MKRLEHLIKEIDEKGNGPSPSLRKSIKNFFRKSSNESSSASSSLGKSTSLQSPNSDITEKEDAEYELSSLEQDKLHLLVTFILWVFYLLIY